MHCLFLLWSEFPSVLTNFVCWHILLNSLTVYFLICLELDNWVHFLEISPLFSSHESIYIHVYAENIKIHLPYFVENTHKVNRLITNWYVLAKLCLPTVQSTLVVHWGLLL